MCNMKEFKVYGGLTLDSMVELLHNGTVNLIFDLFRHVGLRNDSEPETFPLRYKSNNVLFPLKYIKITPLMAWGANFNFSIWYVELRGIADQEVVDRAMSEYLSVCLKRSRTLL